MDAIIEWLLRVLGLETPQEKIRKRLVDACERGDVEAVRRLLQTSPLTSESKTAALLAAIVKDGTFSFESYVPEPGQDETVAMLLDAGANPNAEDENGNTLLYLSCKKKWTEAARLVLQAGADPNRESKEHWPPLSVICDRDYEDILETMLEPNRRGESPLALAIRTGSIDLIRLLLNNEADPNKVDAYGRLPIHQACESGVRGVEVIDLLLNAGIDPASTTVDGSNALHYAATADVARRLLGRGVDVNGTNLSGETPLHSACRFGRPAVAQVLLEAGADVHAKTNSGNRPIHCGLPCAGKKAATVESFKAIMDMLQMLASYGATWDALADIMTSLEHKFTSSLWEDALSHSNWKSVSLAIRACVHRWMSEHHQGLELTNVPIESILRGLEDTETYLYEIQLSRKIIHRRKICVVGPSNWGKTTLIKSIITNKPSLVDPEDRTIGIDHFVLAFHEELPDLKATKKHEITFWDFAGHDEYQVAHSLFFTRRTLYLVCIDLKAYAITYLQAILMTDTTQTLDRRMNWYVETRILRWIRLIFVHQPDAEFEFIGTKTDLLYEELDADAMADMQKRLADVMLIVQEMKEAVEREPGRSVGEAGGVILGTSSQEPMAYLGDPRLATVQQKPPPHIIYSSCTDQTAVAEARGAIKRIILTSRRSYPMPDSYSRALEYITETRKDASRKMIDARIGNVFVNGGELVERLTESVLAISLNTSKSILETPRDLGNGRFSVNGVELHRRYEMNVTNISAKTARIILQTLRDLGDVLWYEGSDDQTLSSTVILDPMLLIDLLRQVANHKHQGESIGHANLMDNKLWAALGDDRMLAMKRLLQRFGLVYPSNGTMTATSDLIIPAYWRTKKSAQILFLGQGLDVGLISKPVDAYVHVHWEIHVSFGFQEPLFDRLVVDSYRVGYDRTVGPDYILYEDEGDDEPAYACRLIMDWHRTNHMRVIRVEAVLAKANALASPQDYRATELWDRFEHVSRSLAKMLQLPGLLFTANAKYTKRERSSELRELKPSLEDCRTPAMTWLPPKKTLDTCRELLLCKP